MILSLITFVTLALDGNDHIGGGGGSNVEFKHLLWDSNIAGNAFDNVGGDHYHIHDSYNYSTRNFYYEGVTNIDMCDVTTFGSIMVESDSGYNPTSVAQSPLCQGAP